MQTGAVAAIGICRRRGLGRFRHLAVADLWVQDKVTSGAFALRNDRGDDNVSAMMTKHVELPLLYKHLKSLSLVFEEGRSPLAPSI